MTARVFVRRLTRLAAVSAAALAVLPISNASAGRLIATGHDADHHCGRGEPSPDAPGETIYKQCNFVKVAVDFVRAGAPDPAKPVLVLDRRSLDVVAALDRVYGPGVVPRTVVSPRDDDFKNVAITTDAFSAVIIASSTGDDGDDTPQDLNERTSAPDSEAINARAADLRAFFNAGGGILAGAGNAHGDGADDPYYGFLPITVQGAAVTYPFALTDLGRSLGFLDDDANCCATHNTFEQPSPDSALRAVDTDAAGRVVTLVADTPRFTALGDPPITPQVTKEVTRDVPTSRRCVPRGVVRIKLRQPKRIRFSRATIYVNRKRVKRLTGRRIVRPIKLRLSTKTQRAAVKIVIVTTGKRKITIKRNYRTCL